MSNQVTLLITDDNNQVRRGLSMLLSSIDGFKVVGEAVNGREALALADNAAASVVLMDVGMPVMDGIEACQKLKRTYPDVKVIMLTSHDSEDDVLASLAAGANGYCLKDANIDRLVSAIKAVAAGDLWLDSQIAEKINRLARQTIDSQSRRTESKGFAALSQREMEIIALVVEGLSNQEIADKLDIGLETVKSHIKHIMDKLAVDDRTQMAVKALRSGIVQ